MALVGGVQLQLNVETSVAGFVAVEVLDRLTGQVVAGMAAEDVDKIKGSAITAVVSWNKGALATPRDWRGRRFSCVLWWQTPSFSRSGWRVQTHLRRCSLLESDSVAAFNRDVPSKVQTASPGLQAATRKISQAFILYSVPQQYGT